VSPLAPDQVVGERYRLLRRIGVGGMADVWCADDRMLDRQVALKFLHERFAQDEQFIERFRREASAAAGLQHPNIVGVYDRGEHEGRHYIAMEYVEGASLKDLIARGLSVGEAVEIVRQVLAAARFAHERGIIHRDLKPQNVLIDREGRARVTDFGIARKGESEITQTGSVLGTAQYLSPEQAQGLEVTAASDLYSVGVLLYEALTGGVPFEADSPVTVALKQVSEQPRPPRELNPAISPALEMVVLSALAKDPAERFRSADEFLRALDAADADPSGAGLAAALPAAAAGATAPTALAPPPASAGGGDAGRDGPERDRWMTPRRAALLGVLILALAAVAAYALTRPEQVRVPTVLNPPRTQDEATRILEAAGFEVAVRTFPNCAPANTVTEQSPPAGSEADEGSTVTISVSIGQSVRVPPVAGLPEGEASERLRDAELFPESQRRFSDAVDAGRAIGTRPPQNEEVDCNSTVVLLVSQGQNLVEVPDVLGSSEDLAESELRRLGFIPNVEPRDADEPEGTVIEQDPRPGSTILKGSEVTIVVSTGAGSVIVPNVIGQTEESAIDTLESRGVGSVRVVEQATEDVAEEGRVLEQAPAAGTRIRGEDEVTIFVGAFIEPPPEEPPPEKPIPPDEQQPPAPK
jgi:eukaryotic-like serine/threonine-protein kinase